SDKGQTGKSDMENSENAGVRAEPGKSGNAGVLDGSENSENTNALGGSESRGNTGSPKSSDVHLLDVGCGSGILGITALLMGAKKVSMIDIDTGAIDNVNENIELNNTFSGKYETAAGDIFKKKDREKLAMLSEKYDIVVANILADVIIPLCDIIKEFMKEGATFITSGILVERKEDVREALIKNDFKDIICNEDGEWCSFVCRA
ncbi:MAG: 50S ribosomal protein L11 methyltransferase, partial [Lachnospiraceae bacterium]|nr:50S ribosomal protein L11 methyltransferase [Lachnospiraceae bacterium]